MRTEAEIRVAGMQALVSALGPVEIERFLLAIVREQFDYTEWRRYGLPDLPLEELAARANLVTEQSAQMAHGG